jgi:hypothetical protein
MALPQPTVYGVPMLRLVRGENLLRGRCLLRRRIGRRRTRQWPPGLRSTEAGYPPGYYAAFVLDPDGNNIEAVFRGTP